jgi:hypothetical protein
MVSMMGAHMVSQDEVRMRVRAHASHVIDVLAGRMPDVYTSPEDPGQELASAPNGIPAVHWQEDMGSAKAGGEDLMDFAASLGEWYASTFLDERPSEVFNTGFYAGVLAAKAGLVDSELFHHEDKLNRQVDDRPDPAAEA